MVVTLLLAAVVLGAIAFFTWVASNLTSPEIRAERRRDEAAFDDLLRELGEPPADRREDHRPN